jgi:leucyl-tRNA synthetase
MSKSRGNVINPDEMVEKFGTDAFRTYIMFMGPFDQAVMWDTNGLVGVRRFLDKVWNISELDSPKESNPDALSKLHQTIKKVGEDIDKMRFNTAVAAMMEFVNYIYPSENDKQNKLNKNDFAEFLKLLSPFAPHLSSELWEKYGNGELAFADWPKFNESLAKEKSINIAVQVNGKVRDELAVDAEISESEIKDLALKSEKVQKWLEGKAPKKIIYVKGKLVSVVV